MKYKCLACEYRFESMNEIPYCPACENEFLEKIEEEYKQVKKSEKEESHHIWPRFMDNKRGVGEQYDISKKTHSILHGKIMNWIWEEIPINLRGGVIKTIIKKSKEFIGVK